MVFLSKNSQDKVVGNTDQPLLNILDVKIDSVSTSALGMAGSTFDSNTLVGQRVGVTSGAAGDLLLDYSAGIQEGDIKINGQDVGAIADASDMETILKAINDNIDNVTASAFNVVVAKNVGTGVTTAGQMVIETLEDFQ